MAESDTFQESYSYFNHHNAQRDTYPVYSGVGPDSFGNWNNNLLNSTVSSQEIWAAEMNCPVYPQDQNQSQPHFPIQAINTPRQPAYDTLPNRPSMTYDNHTNICDSCASAPQISAFGFQVPSIVTQFASRSNTFTEDGAKGFESTMHDTSDVDVLSSDWMKIDTALQTDSIISPDSSNGQIKSASSLGDPFQWQSPVTRRTSMSSVTSGPVFSPHSTPAGTSHRDSVIGTPFSQSGAWTPRSMTSNTFSEFSPQSPSHNMYGRRGRGSQSWTRMQSSYMPLGQRPTTMQTTSQTLPSRRKPPMEHSFSDSSLPNQPAFAYTSHVRSLPGRRRAVSAMANRSEPLSINQNRQQLRLPAYELSSLFASPSPEVSQTGFAISHSTLQTQPTPHQLSTATFPPPNSSPARELNVTTTEYAQENIAPPPPSDFSDPYNKPIRQDPEFEGDIYTPLWKRRDEAGNWEGWCHLCKPGQWLSMKTSRYWDDKKRNHGICANTGRKFPEPSAIRIVDLQGRVVDINAEALEVRDSNGNITDDAWIVSEVDGSLRKREGLCGNCDVWVPVDGKRSKTKGKMSAWWTHCYKCLEQSKKRGH